MATKLKVQRSEEEEDLSAFWLITYSDMTTLLLAFFLLIYSFTVMGQEEQHTLLDALNVVSRGGEATKVQQPLQRIEDTAKEIAAMIAAEGGELPWVSVSETEVTLGLPASITFATGSAQLNTGAEAHLRRAAGMLRQLGTHIRVEGHTDDVPIATAQFPSNWHLSAARAQSVVRVFLEEGVDPHLMQVVGYADAHPRQPNDTPAHREANRRIEIQIVREDQTRKAAAVDQALEAGEPSNAP